MDKRQKGMIIRRLLAPVFLIAGALLYYFIGGGYETTEPLGTTKVDGTSLTVTYLDVGQGDATLITKGDFAMLIDAGNNKKGESVVESIKKAGVESLDVVIGTHPDSDHIGGLDNILENISVDAVYMPTAKKDTKTYEEVIEALDQKNLMAKMPEIGKEYTYADNVVVRFLSPTKSYDGANDNSIVVQLAYGKNRFLFMGDAEEEAEVQILKEGYDLECDVLKVGHHGSYTATGDKLLEKADPVYGVISCGEDNERTTKMIQA